MKRTQTFASRFQSYPTEGWVSWQRSSRWTKSSISILRLSCTESILRTIFLVLIFKYLCIYQKPRVLIVEVIAWARPRYVFCRKEKLNLSFWQIETSVPVVLRPYRCYKKKRRQRRACSTHICEQEEWKEIDKSIRESLVCLECRPDLRRKLKQSVDDHNIPVNNLPASNQWLHSAGPLGELDRVEVVGI